MHFAADFREFFEIGHFAPVFGHGHEPKFRARLFEHVRDEPARLCGRKREGDERGRNVDVFEGTAHAVLSADRAEPQPDLRVQRAEKSRQRHAPAFGIAVQAHEKFLEGEADLIVIAPRRDELSDGRDHAVNGARERCAAHQLCRIPVSGYGSDVRFAPADLRRHRDGWRKLTLSAEGHIHAARADGRVEHLRKPLLGADVEGKERFGKPLRKFFRAALEEIGHFLFDLGGNDLFYAVRIEEIPRNIDDGAPLEEHLHAPVVRNDRDRRRREVLFRCKADKFVLFLCVHDDRHAFLRFGNGKLRTRKSFVFERNFVKVDDQPVGKFADGDGNAARAEVVAFFDAAGGLFIQKQPLQFALGERIALLHFRAAGFHRMRVVRLGRTRGAAAAVAPRFAAEQDDDVARLRLFAVHHVALCPADDEARFQPLRLVAGIVHFVYDTRRKPDLVAVGRKSRRSRFGDDALRKFAGKGVLYLFARICRTRHAHRLIDIRPARKRIADSAAEAGGRSAERLYFGRVVVRFVLEHDEILFHLAVYLRIYADGAGVYLVGNIQIV